MEFEALRYRFFKFMFVVVSVTLFCIGVFTIYYQHLPKLGMAKIVGSVLLMACVFFLDRYPHFIRAFVAISATLLFAGIIFAQFKFHKLYLGIWMPIYMLCIAALVGPVLGIISGFYVFVVSVASAWFLGMLGLHEVRAYLVQLVLCLFLTAVFFIHYEGMWKRYKEILQNMAERDALTGIYSRRKLMEVMQGELERSKRLGIPVSFIMLDLDGFKEINDTRGHVYGDEVLKKVAKAIKGSIRKIDCCGRYGGDEFIVVASGADRKGAEGIAKRISEAIKTAGVTASMGVVECKPWEEDINLSAVLQQLDEAFYEAKRSGKDTVVAKGVFPQSQGA